MTSKDKPLRQGLFRGMTSHKVYSQTLFTSPSVDKNASSAKSREKGIESIIYDRIHGAQSDFYLPCYYLGCLPG